MVKALQVALIVAIALARTVFQLQTPNENTKIDNPMSTMQLYEYCIKIHLVCNFLFDSPPDYNDYVDSNEIFQSPPVTKSTRKKEFSIASCIPENISGVANETFWEKVELWHKEVETMFLDTNMFTIKEELDDGKAIKINLLNIFQIRKSIICNETALEVTEYSDSNEIEFTEMGCLENKGISIWINEQVKISNSLSKFINILPNILNKLELRIKSNCCPYDFLRDRLEIIHDNLDTIMQLKAIDSYNRSKPAGYALLDINNLIIRLEYLNKVEIQGNHSKRGCCNNWETEMKEAQYKFKTKKDSIQSLALAPSSIYKRLSSFQKSLTLICIRQDERLKITEKLHENASVANGPDEKCCNIKDTHWIKHDIQLNDFKNLSNNELYDRVANTTQSIQSTQILVNTEQTNLNQLISMCTAEYEQQQEKLQILYSKLDQIDEQVEHVTIGLENKTAEIKESNLSEPNDVVNDGHKTIGSISVELNSMLSQALEKNKSQINENNKIINDIIAFNASKEIVLNTCLVVVTKVQDMQTLTGIYDANMNFFSHSKLNKDAAVEEFYNKLNYFVHKVSVGSATIELTTKPPFQNEHYILLNSIKTQIEEISSSAANISKDEDIQLKNIMEFESNQESDLAGVIRKIELGDFLDHEIKKLIDRRFSDLQRKLNESISSANDTPDIYKKLDYLEAAINEKTIQRKGAVTRMLELIITLQSRLKTINDKLSQANENIGKCLHDCDFGELPSIEKLLDRLQAVKLIFKKNRTKKL